MQKVQVCLPRGALELEGCKVIQEAVPVAVDIREFPSAGEMLA